jgi:hypothetical protein
MNNCVALHNDGEHLHGSCAKEGQGGLKRGGYITGDDQRAHTHIVKINNDVLELCVSMFQRWLCRSTLA